MTIEQQLKQTWKRERRFCHLRGLCRCLIWLVTLVFLGLVIDFGLLFKTRLPAAVSVLMGVAGVATMLWVIWREWLRHLRPYDATRTALAVEAMHPELMSSLISYTELAVMGRQSEASPELLEAMREFAVETCSQIRFSDVVDFGQIKKLLAFAAVVLFVAAGTGVRWSEHFGVLFRRLAGIDTTYPIQTRLVEITGDVTVPFGQTVDITASAGGVIPDVAVLHVRPAEDREHKWMELPMAGLANGFSFRRALEALDRDMDYFVTMGDCRTGEFRISVVSAPRIVETELRLQLPEYLNRPDETTDQLNVEVPEGTRIDWKLTCDKTVGKLTVVRGAERFDAQVGDSERGVSFSLTADKPFNYTFAWTEGDSGKNFHFEDVEYSVRVIRDAMPRIDFVGQVPDGPATMNKKVTIDWEAKDDHGLAKLWLVHSVSAPGAPEEPIPQRRLLKELNGRIVAADSFEWIPAKEIPELQPGLEINYHLEASDGKPDEKGERIARSPVRQLRIVGTDDYMAWFRRELAARNELVKQTFVAERAASKQLESLLLAAAAPAADLRTLETRQSEEARRLEKVAGDVDWLLEELESNGLLEEGGGKNLQTFKETVGNVANSRLPAVTLHLRDARLEADATRHHMTSAKKEVDAIVEELKRVLAGSSTLLVEEALIQELKDMIKVQAALNGQTAEWTKALLINPDAGAGKGALIEGQRGMRSRYGKFLEQLRQAGAEAFDEASRSRFQQAEHVLNPAPPELGNAAVMQLLEAEPTVGDFLEGAVRQIEDGDGLAAVGAQDRVIAAFRSALQILSAGQFELAEFVAGLERLIEKQRILRKDSNAEEELEKKRAFYEARQVEIRDETTDYSFQAPDLFVSKEGEYLVAPLMIAFEEAIEAIQSAAKTNAVIAQDKVIALLESVYGTVLEKEEKGEEGDPFWADSPIVPEDMWKLPDDGDEEDEALEDEDMPEIFEGITSAELMIQSDKSKGAQDDVSTALAANRMLNFDKEGDDKPPDYITDEAPPTVGIDKDAPREAGGKGEGDSTDVEADRLADGAMQRRQRQNQIQDYARQLPPEFRRQVADYYEVIGE